MSDENDQDHLPLIEPRKVDENDFESFLIAKNIPFSCIMCKGEVQIIQHPKDYLAADISIDFPPDIEKSSFSYTFRTRCKNCGNMQSYDRTEVFRWKNQRT